MDLEKNEWNVLHTFRTVQKCMPFWHIAYNTCNNTPHIIIKKMLEREHITLAITLQVNIKTDTWIGTHNIGYSNA